MGIEPTPSAWKAEVLPLNYTRTLILYMFCTRPRTQRPTQPRQMVEGGGFEPPKAEPSDLQSDPFDRSGTPPNDQRRIVRPGLFVVKRPTYPGGHEPRTLYP